MLRWSICRPPQRPAIELVYFGEANHPQPPQGGSGKVNSRKRQRQEKSTKTEHTVFGIIIVAFVLIECCPMI